MKPIAVPMEAVRTTLAHQSNISSRGAVKVGGRVRHAHSELFQAFHAGGNEVHRRSTATHSVVCNVDAVQRDGILVASRARYSTPEVSETAVGRRVIRRGSRLQRKQLRGVA